MNNLLGTFVFYMGTYIGTKFIINYTVNKITDKCVESSWSVLRQLARKLTTTEIVVIELENEIEEDGYNIVELEGPNVIYVMT